MKKLSVALILFGALLFAPTACQTVQNVRDVIAVATGEVEFSPATQQQVKLSLIGLENIYIFTAERVEDAVDAGLLVGQDAATALAADTAAFAVITTARASLASGNFEVAGLLEEGKEAVAALAAVLGPLF